jgi:hypothetical protein
VEEVVGADLLFGVTGSVWSDMRFERLKGLMEKRRLGVCSGPGVVGVSSLDALPFHSQRRERVEFVFWDSCWSSAFVATCRSWTTMFSAGVQLPSGVTARVDELVPL